MKAVLPCWLLLFGLMVTACGRDPLNPPPQGADAGAGGRGGVAGNAGDARVDGTAGRGGNAGAADAGRGGSGGGVMDVQPGQFPIVILPNEVPLVPVGKTVRLRALVQIADTWRDLSADPTVVWQTSDPLIADVAVGSGRVTGVAAGPAQVGASHPLFGSATVTVRVTAAGIASIAIMPVPITIAVGEDRRLSARANYTDGAVSDITEAALWSTGDQRIARVQNSIPPLGELSGVIAGETTVTASFADAAGTAGVTVNQAGMATLSVAPPAQTESVGGTARFQAVMRLPSGVVTDVSNLASWNSMNTLVARSVGGGQFRCSGAGTAMITALHLGNTAAATLTCTNVGPELIELRISPSGGNAPLFVSTRYRLMLEASFSDGTSTTVSNSQARWMSTDTGIASIDGSATLTGAMPGTVTITASYSGVTTSERYTFIAR
ncbi:MAG TPA: Ig-like domain-containing protein [Polyangia bacterium]